MKSIFNKWLRDFLNHFFREFLNKGLKDLCNVSYAMCKMDSVRCNVDCLSPYFLHFATRALCNTCTLLDRPAGWNSWTGQLDGPARQISWTDHLDRPVIFV